MTTRRALTALLLAATLTASGAGAAPPAPQLGDPTGDWVVGGQDIVWGRLSGILVRGVPHLRAELRLAAPPPPHVPTNYFLRVVYGCKTFEFQAIVDVVDPQQAKPELSRLPYCRLTLEDPDPTTDYPVTVSLRGSTVTWIAPYPAGMKRGAVLSRFSAEAFSVMGATKLGPVPVWPTTVRPIEVHQGDDAYAPTSVYVVGSDLPRR
jgi:hypothetical protein